MSPPAPAVLTADGAGASARRGAMDRALIEALTGRGLLSGDCAALVAALGGAIGWQAGSLLEFDPEQGALCCLISWHHPEARAGGFGEITRGIRFAPGLGLPGRVHVSGEPLWIMDLSGDPNFPRAAAAAEASLHSAFAVPARSERFTGVLEFFSEQTLLEDDALMAEMSAVATHVARYVEHMREHAALRESESVKAAMLGSSFDCIVGMDQNGRVIEFNAAAERVFGYSRSQAVGADLAQLIIPAALREHHRNGLRRYLAGGEGLMLNRRIETRAQRSGGTEFSVELAITHIQGTDPPHFVAYLRDIDDRKREDASG